MSAARMCSRRLLFEAMCSLRLTFAVEPPPPGWSPDSARGELDSGGGVWWASWLRCAWREAEVTWIEALGGEAACRACPLWPGG